MKRRDFVKSSVAAAVSAGLLTHGIGASWASTSAEMPYRRLGHTGEQVSLIGIGGAHLGKPKTDAEAVQIVRSAIDHGVNFMDNSWDYKGGNSEIRMGQALRDGYREKVFLMTKIDGRNAKTAQQQIDQSLQRLQTDRLDLLQFHEIIRMDDPIRIFARGGAMDAALQARQAGKVRYIGFTGHKDPHIHLKMLATAQAHDFRFDAVQMPLNVMDAHYQSFEQLVLPELITQDIGVLAMKPMVTLGSKGVRSMADRHRAAEICAQHSMQELADNYGPYWIHPDFTDGVMIAIDENGNWQDGIPGQQWQVEDELGLSFDNVLEADLDRYLTALFGILQRRETTS